MRQPEPSEYWLAIKFSKYRSIFLKRVLVSELCIAKSFQVQ